MKAYVGSGVITAFIFNLVLGWGEWSNLHLTVLLLEKKSWYPLNRRLGGSQSQSEQFGEEKVFCPLLGFEPQIIQPMAW
jgi:hypothetical protein